MGAKKNRTREEDTRWEVAPRAPFVLAYYYQTPARQAISNPASPAPLGYQQGSGDKVFREAIKVTSHLLPSFLNLGESRELTQEPHAKGDAIARGEKRKESSPIPPPLGASPLAQAFSRSSLCSPLAPVTVRLRSLIFLPGIIELAKYAIARKINVQAISLISFAHVWVRSRLRIGSCNGFPLARNFYVRTLENFTRVNEIEA